jgi:hypothetical protein
VDGHIKVIKNGEIGHFTENYVVLKDGSAISAGLVVFCTGFTGFQDSVRETLGPKYAAKLKRIWGLDAEVEVNGIYRDCGIPNDYYVVGGLAPARFNSKIFALQILAQQLGKFGKGKLLRSRRSGPTLI